MAVDNTNLLIDIQDIQKLVNNTNSSTSSKRDNTINAVIKLLTDLLDEASVKTIKNQISDNGSSSLNINGIGDSGKGNNKYFPSYNARTPIAEISLNGTQIYPKKIDLDTGKYINSKMNFQNLNLKFPLGGVEKSITGSIQLFTKDPKEILIPLDIYAKQGGTKEATDKAAFGTGGLPTLTLKFGWAFSSTTSSNTVQALSPSLTFVITHIDMTDPGTQGTTFTLSLQETGTLVLENSSNDIIILPDYPQEQLRTLLEGLLHVRLFTLDDLLYFGIPGGNNPNTNSNSTTGGFSSKKQVIQNSTQSNLNVGGLSSINNISSYAEQLRTLAIQKFGMATSGYTSYYNTTDLERYLATKPGGMLAVYQLKQNLSLQQPTAPGTSVSGTENTSAAGNSNNQIVSSMSSGVVPDTQQGQQSAAITTGTLTKTFFATQPSAAVGINGRNFFTVANELAAQCRCRWYPHENSVSANQSDNDSITTTKLNALASDLKTIQNMPASISTISDDLLKSIKTNTGTKDTSLTREQAQTLITAQLKQDIAKLSTKCSLQWIPNIPADWKTTGSDINSTGLDPNGKSIPYDVGAFFLLPDILNDYTIFLSDLPVQYGPGASSMPYLYGSGQNVFQVATQGNTPQMFGEVIALSVSHSDLIAALTQAANEKKAYAVQGKWFGQIEPAIAYQNQNTNSLFRPDSSEDTTKSEAAAAKQLQKSRAVQGDIRSSFKGSVGTGKVGKLAIFDGDDMSGQNRSLSCSDIPVDTTTGPAQSASYMIQSRVATFLRWPTTAKITILGDPNLIRLGPGCFELLSYYPVEHVNPITGVITTTQELNALTSGLYFVNHIEHSISGDNFITVLDGQKVIDPSFVPSSLTNQMTNILHDQQNTKQSISNTVNGAINLGTAFSGSSPISPYGVNQVSEIDLNSSDFTTGTFATDLKIVLNTYYSTVIKNTQSATSGLPASVPGPIPNLP